MLTPATLTAETDAALLIADELEKSNVIFVTLRQVQEQNRALREQAPQVRLVRPQATYIPLLDMGELGMDSAALKDFMANQVGAALNAGDTFGPGGEQFMRINVATQRENLEQFVSRLRLALEHLV